MKKVSIFLVFFFFISISLAAAENLPLVNKIDVTGLKRIEEGAVRARISQRIGEPISREKTNEDIKAIFKMGYFDDVKVDIEAFEGGVKLIYAVKEKPTIVKIDFQGNSEYDDEKLKEKITITPGAIADTVLIQENALKLKAFYEEEGYWLANIVPVVRKINENDTALTYQITEGSKVRISKINIEGNKNISTSKIKKAMETKEWWLFSFISSGGYYKKKQMDTDLDKIRGLYFNEGYIKVVVAEPDVDFDSTKSHMTITIRISEGEQYGVSSIDFTGNKVYDSGVIKSKITMQPGPVFHKDVLEKDIQSIASLYSDNGYALAAVMPDIIPDEKKKTIKVILNINEGDQYRIGRIEISGNTKTKDKVIRREIRFDEGDIFDSSKLKRSYERINNLNFFETIDISPKPRQTEKKVDLDVKVKERSTNMLSIGGGYSSVDRFIVTSDITMGNLFGNGQFLKIKGQLGGTSQNYEISFKDPWFMDKPLSFSAGIFKNFREYIEYRKDSLGFYFGFGKSLAEYWNANISYSFERAKISNIKEGASTVIWDQEGIRTTSAITPTISRDTRDNYLDPTRGSRNSLEVTFAGLGGTNAFIKGDVDSSWYFPFYSTTFMLRGRFGYAQGIFGKSLPLYERYYVGGIYTVRGLGFGEAGPKDPKTDDAIGGTTQLIFNSEYIFPLIADLKLKGVIFVDAGKSYEDFQQFGQLKYTTGTGVRWISPIGPIRIEWGFNLNKKPGESSSKIEFAFGSFF